MAYYLGHITKSGMPDPITPQTSAKIAADSLAHCSYPTAPVSNLYVFGRIQDLAFEKPTNDVQNRGHIRIWKTGALIGGQSVWVGAVSYRRTENRRLSRLQYAFHSSWCADCFPGTGCSAHPRTYALAIRAKKSDHGAK